MGFFLIAEIKVDA